MHPLGVERGRAVIEHENGARDALEPPREVQALRPVRRDQHGGTDTERTLRRGPGVLRGPHGGPEEADRLRLDARPGPVRTERLVAQVQHDGSLGRGRGGGQRLPEQLGGAAARHQDPIDPLAAGPVDEGVDVVAREAREQRRAGVETEQVPDPIRVESERLVAAAQGDAPTHRPDRTTPGVWCASVRRRLAPGALAAFVALAARRPGSSRTSCGQ